MKKLTLLLILAVGLIFSATNLQAQVTIGSNANPDANALLDLKNKADGTADKGFLLPRVALNSTASPAPLTAHVAGMTVYNVAPAVNDVTPGYYYNDGKKWVRIADSGSFWSLTGNAGTAPTANFLGTTDNQPLNFRTNKTQKMTILPDGNVGIGTTTPTSKLYVKGGSIQLDNLNTFTNSFIDIGVDGCIEIFRNCTDCTYPQTKGYIDFKDDINKDFDMRIAYLKGLSTESDQIGKLVFYGDGVPRFVMRKDNGNVGLDLSLPTEKLEVNGNVSVGKYELGYADTEDKLGYGNRLFFNGKIDNSDALFMARYNNAIDASELRMLIGDNFGKDKFVIGNAAGEGNNPYTNSFNPLFSVYSNGVVGIGTTAPTEKLEVAGKIKAANVIFTGIPTYTNDATAGAGGLVSGEMYKTATGELRIKL